MKKILMVVMAAALMGSSAYAVPAITLYSPDATYDNSTQTWVVNSSNFELWVLTANTIEKPLYGVRLVAALGAGETPVNGALTIGSTTFDASDFTYDTPPLAHDSGSYPPHGIYPTNFVEMYIGDVLDAPDLVYDMQPGQTGSAMGKIFKYQVSTSYDMVHFDAFGYYDPYHFKFAPNSHDAEYVIPEPSTLVLVGFGLLAGGLLRRRKM